MRSKHLKITYIFYELLEDTLLKSQLQSNLSLFKIMFIPIEFPSTLDVIIIKALCSQKLIRHYICIILNI